jgi:hypothetical protein
MDEKHSVKLLEVAVVDRNGFCEWQVRAGDELLESGSEATRIAARFAGNDARSLILSSGRTHDFKTF